MNPKHVWKNEQQTHVAVYTTLQLQQLILKQWVSSCFIFVFFNWFAGFSWEIFVENDQHCLRKFDEQKKFVAQAILPAPTQGTYMIVIYSSGMAALRGGAQEKSCEDTMDEILKGDTGKTGLNN